jgi:hypothetical protein
VNLTHDDLTEIAGALEAKAAALIKETHSRKLAGSLHAETRLAKRAYARHLDGLATRVRAMRGDRP